MDKFDCYLKVVRFAERRYSVSAEGFISAKEFAKNPAAKCLVLSVGQVPSKYSRIESAAYNKYLA